MSDHNVRPFAELPDGPRMTDEPLGELVDAIVSKLEVAAILIDVPEVGPTAGLLMSYELPDGQPGPRVALIGSDAELTALGDVVVEAIASAVRHAEAAR